MTITIKDSGGTTLDSGTTDASGNFTSTDGCGSNRTIVVAALGYTTTTFTGQNLACGTTLSLDMTGSLDTTNYVCCNCAVPRTINFSFSNVINGVPHSGSGTRTYVELGINAWHVALGDLICFNGHLVLSIQYSDPDTGSISCHMLPDSISCNPFSLHFGLPTDPPCTNFAADTGMTSFSMTITP
jgi:hypothetical protein